MGQKHFEITKVESKQNLADLMTKHLNSEMMQGYLKETNMQFSSGRADSALMLKSVHRKKDERRCVYEDDSSLCGNMIAKVTARYKENQYGRAFDATPLACFHKDFRRYMEQNMKKKSCRFHLCRSDGSECG